MAARVRATDWSRTPLGPVGSWPRSLRALVGVVLEHPMPTVLLWGAELTQVYNDAYAVLAAAKHPAALGMPTRQCWPEAWHINQPIYEAVLSRGEAVLREDALYPLERHGAGHPENAYFTVSYSPARDDAGRIAGVFITITETTRKVSAEERLRQSEALLAEAQEVAHVGSWNWDLRTNAITWSAEHYRIVGLPPQSAPVAAERALTYVHPDDRAAAWAAIDRAQRTREPYVLRLRIVREDGAQRVVESRGRAAFDADGQPVRMFGVMQDVTEREEALADARVANARLDLAMRASNIGVWEVELPDGTLGGARLRRTNLVEQFGYPADAGDVGADQAMALVHPEDRAGVAETFARYLAGARQEYEVEHRLRHADGSYRWVVSRGVGVRDPDGRPVRLIGTTIDVTERKRAEEERATVLALERAAVERELLLKAERDARAEAEQRTREAEEARSILQTIFDNVPEAVVLTGGPPDFPILANSRHVRDLIGRPVDAAIGIPAGRHAAHYGLTLPDGTRPRPQDLPLYRAAHGERVRNVELLVQRPNGSRLPVLIDAAPVRDSHGRLIGAVTCWRDITERKRVEDVLRAQAAQAESRRRLDAVLLAGAVGTWQWDVVNDRVSGDEPFERMFNVPHDGTGAAPLGAYLAAIHPEDRGRVAALVSGCLDTGCDYEAEYRVNHADGRPPRWLLARGKPQRDASGRVVSFPGVVIDVTALKQAEARVARAKEEAERANRVKDEFLATLSHELRTPLAAILLWGKMLADGVARSPADRERAVGAILASAEAQNRLIVDLLDVSRMAAGTLRVDARNVELAPLLLAAADEVRPAARAQDLRFDVTPAGKRLTVRGDAGRLRQVVTNLLTNALKFTPPGGHVELRWDRVGDAARVSVRDSGQGISPEFLPHVFDRFRQADTGATRAHGGLGLGLAIVRELVELHGGHVAAESDGPGRGSAFTVELPLAVDAAAAGGAADLIAPAADDDHAANAAGVGRQPLAGLRILVVEDEPQVREALAWVLSSAGAAVTDVNSAAAAMQALADARVDVLVSDIGLPGEDGHSLIRRVRRAAAERGRPPVPSLALTAYARPEDRQRALDAGFDAYAAKPVGPAELIRTVSTLAGRAASAGDSMPAATD
jgi:PAS domain S-box-containing protein